MSGSDDRHRPALAIVATGAYVVVTSVSPYLYGDIIAWLVVVAMAGTVLSVGYVPKAAAFWTLSVVGLGLFGMLLGNLNDNPGANASLSVYVLEPFVLGLLFGVCATSLAWRKSLYRTFDLAIIGVSLVGLLLIASSATSVQVPTWVTGDTYTAVDFEGVARTNYQGYGSLAFLAPYAVVRAMRPGESARLARILVAAAALTGVLLSGRNIYFVAIPLAVLITGLSLRILGKKKDPSGPSGSAVLGTVLIVFAGLLVVSRVVGLKTSLLLSNVVEQITLSDESGTRVGQSRALINGWLESPVFGKGVGDVLPTVVRNLERPWIFEQTFEWTLFQFGALGFTILFIWVAWIATRLAAAAAHGDAALYAPVLAGLVGAVISSSVNPYLTRFDGMWMIFIPFGLAAAYVARKEVPNK